MNIEITSEPIELAINALRCEMNKRISLERLNHLLGKIVKEDIIDMYFTIDSIGRMAIKLYSKRDSIFINVNNIDINKIFSMRSSSDIKSYLLSKLRIQE